MTTVGISGSVRYAQEARSRDARDGTISFTIGQAHEKTGATPTPNEQEDITINYRIERIDSAIGAEDDFFEPTGSITIKKNDTPYRTITLNLKPDGEHEPPENYRLILESPVNATLGTYPLLLQQVDFEIPREYGHSATVALTDKGRQPDKIKLIEGLIFVGMCARHYDNLDRQKAMLMTGLNILNNVYENL